MRLIFNRDKTPSNNSNNAENTSEMATEVKDSVIVFLDENNNDENSDDKYNEDDLSDN